MEKTFVKESTRFVVNSDYFSPRDYALFVDSLETIWRIEQQHETRQANGEKRKRTTSEEKNTEDANEDMPNRSKTKQMFVEKTHVDDENYFSASSANSPIVGTYCYQKSNVNGTDVHNISDSEDSGFNPIGPIYENFTPAMSRFLRRHSSLDNLQGTLRSRLIKVVRKHNMIQKRKEGDRIVEMNNNNNNKNKMKFKFKTLSLRRKPKTPTTVKNARESDVDFITKALSYLTF